MAVDQMMDALEASKRATTKFEAGQVLAAGGWAVFPLPDMMKFDHGFSYRSATTSPAEFDDMAETVMRKNECLDVNIALAPYSCAVPLVVIDLDGYDAVVKFADEAREHGQDIKRDGWLTARTTRPDGGRHVFLACGTPYGNASHRWGGEVRSAKGHVVIAPSTTATGRYAWQEGTIYTAPEWVTDALTITEMKKTYDVSGLDFDDVIGSWSVMGNTSYGQKALDAHLEAIRTAVKGDHREGRNPTTDRAIRRLLDLAMDGHVNALEAIFAVRDAYAEVKPEASEEDISREILRMARSWAGSKDPADIRASVGSSRWAARHGDAREVLTRLSDWETKAEVALKSVRSIDDTRLREWYGK